MSAVVRTAGFRIARRFGLAVVLTAAVAGGAAVTAGPAGDLASRQVLAGAADNNWPSVPVTTEDNNWPSVPGTTQDNNWPSVPGTTQDNNWPSAPAGTEDNNWPSVPVTTEDNNWPSAPARV